MSIESDAKKSRELVNKRREYAKKYINRPGVKEKRNARMREYSRRPEVKEKSRIRNKTIYAIYKKYLDKEKS